MERYNPTNSNIFVLFLVITTALLALWAVKYAFTKSLDLDGPPNPSWFYGTNLEPTKNNEELQEKLRKDYGKTVKYYGMFGTEALYISDPVALHTVTVKDSSRYGRLVSAPVFKAVMGGGLFSMWGTFSHANLGAATNIAFSGRFSTRFLSPSIFANRYASVVIGEYKRLTKVFKMAIFDDIALQTCDAIMRDQRVQHGQTFDCDIYRYMNASALELIGQAGLGYSFGSFSGRRDEYSIAIKHLLPALTSAAGYLPFLARFKDFGTARFRKWVVEHAPSKAVQSLRELVRIQYDQAHEVLASRKMSIASGYGLDSTAGGGRDVMTLLMKANETLPAQDQMSIDEMIGHMNTFIFAGHETTSGAVTRVIDTLAKLPGVQERLRAELSAFLAESEDGDIDRDKIDTLPYLDAVCREVLRLMPPVSMGKRVCLEDSVLPLKYPVNTSNGPQTSIFVPKGTIVNLGIYGINRDKDVWGPDAEQFNPERWLKGQPAAAEGSPGTYSHMMTFLAGPAACIGFKFAVLEIKILLTRLITRFKFEHSDKEFVWQLSITQAPYRKEDADLPASKRKAQLTMKMTVL